MDNNYFFLEIFGRYEYLQLLTPQQIRKLCQLDPQWANDQPDNLWIALFQNYWDQPLPDFALENPKSYFLSFPRGQSTYIASGLYHSVGLRANGTVKTWGDDSEGQRRDEPDEADFVQIASGWHHSVGLRKDGTVKTWGQTKLGQRKDEPSLDDNTFVQIACGNWHSVGLRKDGTVKTWGNTTWDQRKEEADFVQIA